MSTSAVGAACLSCIQRRGPACAAPVMLRGRCPLPASLSGLWISIPARKRALSKRGEPKAHHCIRWSCTSNVSIGDTEALAAKIYLSLPNSFASWAPLHTRAVRRDGSSLTDIEKREGLSDLGYNEVIHCRGWLEGRKETPSVPGVLLRLPSLCCPCTPGMGMSFSSEKSRAPMQAKPKDLFSSI